jgi:RNA polymerase sigma factor (sigma-70 family)
MPEVAVQPIASSHSSPSPMAVGEALCPRASEGSIGVDTAALTSAMARGDEAAIERFYRLHFDRLYRQARRCTRRDESFCLDVVQDSVLRIVRTVRRVESDSQFKSWLKLVVRTTAYDRLRAELRRQRREGQTPPRSQGGDGNAIDAERIEWLRARIRSMDRRLVEMIDLRYRQRWPLARIAAKLGLSVGTIDGRLRRALKHLRELAREELDDDDGDN